MKPHENSTFDSNQGRGPCSRTERLLHESEVAKMLAVSIHWLRRQRWLREEGKGPPFVRIGGAVRYCPIKLRLWIEANNSNAA